MSLSNSAGVGEGEFAILAKVSDSAIEDDAAVAQRTIRDEDGHSGQVVVDDLVEVQDFVWVGVGLSVFGDVAQDEVLIFEPRVGGRVDVGRVVDWGNGIEQSNDVAIVGFIKGDRTAIEGVEHHVLQFDDGLGRIGQAVELFRGFGDGLTEDSVRGSPFLGSWLRARSRGVEVASASNRDHR